MNFSAHLGLFSRSGRFEVPVVLLRGLLAAVVLLSAALPARTALAQPWLLTQAERKAYLQHYAPVIMQRAEENSSKNHHNVHGYFPERGRLLDRQVTAQTEPQQGCA